MTGNVFPAWLVAWPNMWLCPLSSLRRVLLVSCWRGPETNENSQIWGCLACRWPPLLTTRFLQSACLGRVSTTCSCAWLDPCCTVSWFTLSFHCRTTLLTPRTPLNREGALVLRLRSRRIPSKVGSYIYIYIYIYTYTYYIDLCVQWKLAADRIFFCLSGTWPLVALVLPFYDCILVKAPFQ